MIRAACVAAWLLAAPASGAELKLATWNVAWLTLRAEGDPTLPRDRPRRDAAALDRLAAYARRLDADIVALQEVDGPEAAARVFDPARYRFHFAAESDPQRNGFAIRRELTYRPSPDLAALDIRPQARRSHRRGADITVEGPGGPLRLLSVHLNAGCREAPIAPPRDRECDDLARQAAVLGGWVAARRRENVPFAILGDLNRRLDDTDDPFLAAVSGADPLHPAAGRLRNPCWADHPRGRPFVEHILLSPAAARRVVAGSFRVMVFEERGEAWRERLSDHCPISLRLRDG